MEPSCSSDTIRVSPKGTDEDGGRPNAAKKFPLAPFQYGTFRALWSATLFSNLGGLVQTVGAGWMMATIAHSDDMVALVQASTTLPVMIFSVAAGALADNFDRRRIMLTAQILLLVISVALAAFAYFGMLTPWMLLGFTFLIGCGGALHNPSWQASMGTLFREPTCLQRLLLIP